MRSNGEVTLLENAMVSRDENTHSIFLKMGFIPDPLAWEDELNRSLYTNVTITLYLWHMVDSVVNLYHPGNKEPFATFPLKKDSFSDDLVNVLPELFPKTAEESMARGELTKEVL